MNMIFNFSHLASIMASIIERGIEMPDQTNILVIDDEQIMRDGCSRILSKDGWSVIMR